MKITLQCDKNELRLQTLTKFYSFTNFADVSVSHCLWSFQLTNECASLTLSCALWCCRCHGNHFVSDSSSKQDWCNRGLYSHWLVLIGRVSGWEMRGHMTTFKPTWRNTFHVPNPSYTHIYINTTHHQTPRMTKQYLPI